MFDRFTEAARRSVMLAMEQAEGPDLALVDLVIGLAESTTGVARDVLLTAGLNAPIGDAARRRHPGISQAAFSEGARRALTIAESESRQRGRTGVITTGHLLLGVIDSDINNAYPTLGPIDLAAARLNAARRLEVDLVSIIEQEGMPSTASDNLFSSLLTRAAKLILRHNDVMM